MMTHKNIASRLYRLLTGEYKTESYRIKEIKRFVQSIYKELIVNESPSANLHRIKDVPYQFKDRTFYCYDLGGHYHTVILFDVYDERAMVKFINASNCLEAFSKWSSYVLNMDRFPKHLYKGDYVAVIVS